VIEHNLDVIKNADWLIDLGPAGGERGGYLLAEGTPEDIARIQDSATGRFLRQVLGVEVSSSTNGARPTARKRAPRGVVYTH
jgi:excinuclease ABC subunit A